MRLTDCFIDLIVYIGSFIKTAEARQPSFESIRTEIKRRIEESRELLESGSFSHEEYDMARFAIFCWIDETIQNSFWHEKRRWRNESLQRAYYPTTAVNEQFFEGLDLVEPRRGDVREVYSLCLAMGFTGRYCHEGGDWFMERLKALADGPGQSRAG